MSIVLMRHAESHHNVVKKQLKSKYHMLESLKKTSEYRSIKTNPAFKDETISHQGSIETEVTAKLIDWDRIQIILVSPMKRCLQTCKILLSKANRNIQVKAIPQLKGRLSGSWDYGSALKDLKHSYSQYNFDSLTEEPEIPWYVKTLRQNKLSLYSQHKHSEQSLFQHLQQDYDEFRNRVEKAKKIIESHTKRLKQGSKVLVITHSCVLRTLTAKQFDEKGKGISSYKFPNCTPVTVSGKKATEMLKTNSRIELSFSDENTSN